MIKFNSKNHEIEYPPSPMDQFDLNLTSFKLSYASQAPSGPARLRWENGSAAPAYTTIFVLCLVWWARWGPWLYVSAVGKPKCIYVLAKLVFLNIFLGCNNVTSFIQVYSSTYIFLNNCPGPKYILGISTITLGLCMKLGTWNWKFPLTSTPLA